MTFATGSATDLEDLLSKLSTFAVTTHGGWTEGYLNTTNGWFELSKGSLSVSFKYVPSGPPEHLSIHHATAFAGSGIAPGKHTNDSNNGYNTSDTGHSNSQLLTERCISQIGDGPFPSYYFFADTDYIHVVVEIESNIFRHFGFGILDKFGDNWTGGEYVYGHIHDQNSNAGPVTAGSHTLLDGLATDEDEVATLRLSGLDNMPAGAQYGVCKGSASSIDDQAGNERVQIHGGFRTGMEAKGFGIVNGSNATGLVPMYSIGAYYRDPDNPRVYLLGYMHDVRALNIRNFAPKEEVTIGSDTWVIFPMALRSVDATANRTRYSGIAYKKIT